MRHVNIYSLSIIINLFIYALNYSIWWVHLKMALTFLLIGIEISAEVSNVLEVLLLISLEFGTIFSKNIEYIFLIWIWKKRKCHFF